MPSGPVLLGVLGTLDFVGRVGLDGGLAVGQPFGGPNGEIFAIDFRVVSDVDWERGANQDASNRRRRRVRVQKLQNLGAKSLFFDFVLRAGVRERLDDHYRLAPKIAVRRRAFRNLRRFDVIGGERNADERRAVNLRRLVRNSFARNCKHRPGGGFDAVRLASAEPKTVLIVDIADVADAAPKFAVFVENEG